jgi:hypothetical protein
VGERSKISKFYADLKEVTHWDLKPETPRKEREGVRERRKTREE